FLICDTVQFPVNHPPVSSGGWDSACTLDQLDRPCLERVMRWGSGTDGSNSSLAHSRPFAFDYPREVCDGDHYAIFVSQHEGQEGLLVRTDRQRAHALLQRRQDCLRDDRKHRQEQLSESQV